MNVKMTLIRSNVVKRCMTWEVEGIRQRRSPKRPDGIVLKDDMESLGLSKKDA